MWRAQLRSLLDSASSSSGTCPCRCRLRARPNGPWEVSFARSSPTTSSSSRWAAWLRGRGRQLEGDSDVEAFQGPCAGAEKDVFLEVPLEVPTRGQKGCPPRD